MENKSTLNPTSFLSSVFKFSIATWVNAIIYGVSLLLVSYLLDNSVYGVFDLFITASNTLMSVAALGLDHSYIRFYNEPPRGCENSKQLAAACMTLSIAALFAFSLLMCVFFPKQVSGILYSGDYPRLVVLMCVNALFLLVTRFFNITYRMRQNVRMYTLQSILLQFFTRMFFLVGAIVKPTLDSVVAFNVAGLGVFALAFFFIQRKTMLPERFEVKKTAYPPLLKYGLGLAPTTVMLWLNSLFSRVYVNAVMGKAEQGIYSFVSQMTLVLGIIQAGFSTFWSAFIFANYKKEQQKIIRVHDYLTFAVLLLMALLILAEPLIFAIIGPSYREGMSIFALALFAPMLLIVSETTVYGIEIEKKTVFDTIGMALSIGANVLLCMVLVPKYGMAGAAAAVSAGGAFMFIFRTVIAQRLYKSMANPAKTYLSLALMAVLCIVSFMFSEKQSVVCGLAAALSIYYCFAYKKEFKRCLDLLRQVLASMKARK